MERQAREPDNPDDQLRRLASQALDLGKITRGDHAGVQAHGVLTSLGADIETTGARFDQARRELEATITCYRRAAAENRTPAVSGAVVVQGRSAAALARTTLVGLPIAPDLGTESASRPLLPQAEQPRGR